MRLICPNCEAQYEVDPAVIPEAGRDVQCSNCGHTWWQRRVAAGAVPGETPAEAGAAGDVAMPAREPESRPAETAEAAPGPAPAVEEPALPEAAGYRAAEAGAEAGRDALASVEVPATTAEPAPEAPTPVAAAAGEGAVSWPEAPDDEVAGPRGAGEIWPEGPGDPGGAEAPSAAASLAAAVGRAGGLAAVAPPAPPQAPMGAEDDTGPAPVRVPRRSLDEAVLDVLRQEAERESRAREAEGQAVLESQPDLGLSPSGAGAAIDPAARERLDRMKAGGGGGAGGRPEGEAERATRHQRRSTLPDIEEINSTLAGHEAGPAVADDAEALAAAGTRRSGFRFGFTLMILIAIAIVAIYSYADRIVATWPGLAEEMQVFVQTLDTARRWLDTAALNATEVITRLSADE